mmetsp:Transcript_57090/g.183459  ORF Transcript_57090/g.183459 Transcript_57090/m.183459 type:complete len:219 (+) Transcript_57090:414-1070(+)
MRAGCLDKGNGLFDRTENTEATTNGPPNPTDRADGKERYPGLAYLCGGRLSRDALPPTRAVNNCQWSSGCLCGSKPHLIHELLQGGHDAIHRLPTLRARHGVGAVLPLEVLVHQDALERRPIPCKPALAERPEECPRADSCRWHPAARVQVDALAVAALPKADREVAVRSAHVQVDDDGGPVAADDEVQAPLAPQAPNLLDLLRCGHAGLRQLLGGRG